TDQNGSSGTQGFTINVAFIDADKDGLPDTWERLFFGDLSQGGGDDPDKDGRPNLKEYQDGGDPTKYDGPSAPTIISPDQGANAPTKPTLLVGDAMGSGKDPLLYEFQVYGDAQLQNIVDVNINVMPGGMGTTSYAAGQLAEDRHYFWRARARDLYVA